MPDSNPIDWAPAAFARRKNDAIARLGDDFRHHMQGGHGDRGATIKISPRRQGGDVKTMVSTQLNNEGLFLIIKVLQIAYI